MMEGHSEAGRECRGQRGGRGEAMRETGRDVAMGGWSNGYSNLSGKGGWGAHSCTRFCIHSQSC
jgi:hypothetical protein